MDILARNLLILASAGSGKTFQLSNRIIGLITKGATPDHIVALTFTRKAAGEFADSVLTKLATAAIDPAAAQKLCSELGISHADFLDVLSKVTRSLHRITLGTMDSFFAKIVRGFQYELGLTGGRFELIEGPQAEALLDEIVMTILGDVLNSSGSTAFCHAFRRATIGKEHQSITSSLRKFISDWHDRYRDDQNLVWGPNDLTTVDPDDWEKHKDSLASKITSHLDDVTYTRKGQRESLAKEIAFLTQHTTGSGSLGSKISKLMESILQAVATQPSGSLTLKSHSEFHLHGPAADALREMVQLAANCELAAATERTRSIRDVVECYDSHCQQKLRSKGRLGFNDVKLLMGQWAHSEDARLRRESVDFRLDATIDHWLLDEFQDTSRADWNGLLPLIDEAATDSDRSMFIVGDRKQSIYAWRGGDVTLFDEVENRYSGGLSEATLTESWRSCPEVLSLVNQICGDSSTIQEFFGEAADHWEWENHVSAAPLLTPAKRGHAQVEVVGEFDARLERMVELLQQLEVGKRQMTCGVLLRSNAKARQVADVLRSHGFDVILEGHRESGKDSQVGIAITHLLKWISNPADNFARGTMEMSPLANLLRETHGNSWSEIWTNLTEQISINGYHDTIQRLIAPLADQASIFGMKRADDLLSALATFDQQGNISATRAAALLERLVIPQSPGNAAIQVMTIHKSKGLGFDVVILPDIPDDSIPQTQHFDVVVTPKWLTEAPAKWVRDMIPAIQSCEESWGAKQRYEALCTLYVALTRAKRGLYLLLDEPAKSADPNKPSLTNWVITSSGGIQESPILCSFGDIDWAQQTPSNDPSQPNTADTNIQLAKSAKPTKRSSVAPSKLHAPSSHNPEGMQFGMQVHSLLEQISWIDESPPSLPDHQAGHAVQRILANPAIRALFERKNRHIRLLREQATDAVIDGKFISGVIDRLHLHANADGDVTEVDIIDFKTDAAETADLIARHSAQLECYRSNLQALYPNAKIRCWIIAVTRDELIQLR